MIDVEGTVWSTKEDEDPGNRSLTIMRCDGEMWVDLSYYDEDGKNRSCRISFDGKTASALSALFAMLAEGRR